MSTSDGCYPWQTDCEWTARFLWRWMSPFGRLDVIVLALALLYLLVVAFHVFCRYYVARRQRGMDRSAARALVAALNVDLGNLKSIAITAPYLGLVGTCVGIMTAFRGVGMEKHAAMALISTNIALSLLTTASAIPVAVLATCFHNSLRTRIDSLESEDANEGQRRRLYFRGTRRFPQTKRFAELPAFGRLGPHSAFGLLAALGLTLFLKVYMPFPSLPTPRGFYVELPSDRCESDGDDTLLVLHITDAGEIFLNQEHEDWNRLADRLSQIYGIREHRTIYLLADADVPFQTVAQAINTVENAPATDIKIQLVTPRMSKDCLLKPVLVGSGHRVAK